MSNKWLAYLLSVLVLFSFMLVACSPANESAAPEAEETVSDAPAEVEEADQVQDVAEETVETSGEFEICQLNTNLAEPWMVQMDEDIKVAAAEYPNDEFPNVSVSVQYKDAQGDVLRQRAQLEECVIAGVDAILISPVEAGPMTGPVADAIDKGIPVFLIARGVDGDKYTQYVGSDEFALGYAGGQWIADNYGGAAPKVVELQGLMTSSPAQERHEGFMAALEGSDAEVIFAADAGWSEPDARAEMESALAVHDQIDVVFGANDPSAHGAYIAAKAVDREEEMAFIGIDGLPYEGLVYVADGVFAMTIIDATGGDIALHNAVTKLTGGDVDKLVTKNAILFDKNGETVVEPPGEVGEAEEVAEESVAASGDFEICQLNTNLAEPWMVQMDEDIKTAAAEYPNDEFENVTVSVQYKDAQGDVLRQRAQLEECVIAGVDAILISPVEAGPMTGPVAEAIDKGIPVFLIARGVDGDKYTQYVGSDEFALGYAGGQWIVDNYGGTAPKIVELQGLMTSSPAQERHEGFMAALEGSDAEVIFAADAGWSEPDARAEMESALAVHDQIDVVFGANDPSAHGAYIAAKAVDREEEMVFIGIDGLPYEGLVYVADGVFAMTIIDATGGDIALHNAVTKLTGGDVEKLVTKNAILFDENGETVVEPPTE